MKLRNINEAIENITLHIQNKDIIKANDYMNNFVPFELNLKDETKSDIDKFKTLSEQFWNTSAGLKDEVTVQFKREVKNLFETIEK